MITDQVSGINYPSILFFQWAAGEADIQFPLYPTGFWAKFLSASFNKLPIPLLSLLGMEPDQSLSVLFQT